MPVPQNADFGFTKGELALFRRLQTPDRIQRFLDDEVAYNTAYTCFSPRKLLRERRGHCVEGALFAASALRLLGHEPLILDMAAQRDNDHVIALFRQGPFWGAIAKANYSVLRYRA